MSQRKNDYDRSTRCYERKRSWLRPDYRNMALSKDYYDWFVAMIYDIVAVETSLTFRQSERLCPPICMQMTGK